MKEFLYKTQEGIELNEKEELKLLKYLGFFKVNTILKSLAISFSFCTLLLIILLIKKVNFGYYFIPLILFLLTLMVVFSIPYKNRMILYNDLTDELYKKVFKEYLDYDSFMLGNNSKSNFILQNKTLLLFSNGYDFYLYEDIMRKSNVQTTKNGYIKVINNANLEPFKFNVKDIYSFKLNGNISENNHVFNLDTFDDKVIEDYVDITLNDFKTISLTTEIYLYLKEKIPFKEIKNDWRIS